MERIDHQPDISSDAYASFLVEESESPKPNCKARKLLACMKPSEREVLYRLLSLILRGTSPVLQWEGFNLCVEHAIHSRSSERAYTVYLLAHTVGSGVWFQQQFDLTCREGEVCHLLLNGLPDRQIAAMLNISYWTVRIHVGRILEKLAINSRAGVGLAVLKAGHNTTFDKELLSAKSPVAFRS